MNNTTSFKKAEYGYLMFYATALLLLASMILMVKPVNAATFVQLIGQLDYGQTSTNVTNLQVFLASSPTIYPQGLVTGYFGPLTKSAVMNFQSAYGISQVGRVGPQTLTKINSLIASGTPLIGSVGINYGNTIAPIIYANSVSVSPSSNGVVINWTTNEATKAMVYYSTTPFQLNDATTEFTRPSIIGGSVTPQTLAFQSNQSIAITNLSSHTTYYYMIEAADMDGNFSYMMPKTFVTN